MPKGTKVVKKGKRARKLSTDEIMLFNVISTATRLRKSIGLLHDEAIEEVDQAVERLVSRYRQELISFVESRQHMEIWLLLKPSSELVDGFDLDSVVKELNKVSAITAELDKPDSLEGEDPFEKLLRISKTLSEHDKLLTSSISTLIEVKEGLGKIYDNAEDD